MFKRISSFSLFNSNYNSRQTTPVPSEVESRVNTPNPNSLRDASYSPESVARVLTPVSRKIGLAQLKKNILNKNLDEVDSWVLQDNADECSHIPLGEYFFIELKSRIYILSLDDEPVFNQYLEAEKVKSILEYAGEICFEDDYSGVIKSCTHRYKAPDALEPMLPEVTNYSNALII
ncbi:MAG: hypothetical protein Q8R83_09385 [Legionellaceae bacterium]|nr:hypothetical protein [Legionellaceae bacterium]